MAIACPRCSRQNPAEANYCYFDGSTLSGTRGSGPVQMGSLPFPRPFVFPDGTACANFNQLVMGCQRNWSLARDLLRQGQLGPFFAGMGRMDLAHSARRAAESPDADRALDQFLAALPSDVLQPPQLAVEPREINLGQIAPGTDGHFELVLSNQGMRLLAGAVASSCDWLVLGDGPGQSQKVFQTTAGAHIPVKLLTGKLRAGPKAHEGQLNVDSNGGSMKVVVRVEVPARPFPSGLLAGALSPRDIASKSMKNPKEAALLFEQGVVEKWYKTNGWTYPVQGPAGSGLAAVQQFLEAVGLTRPPKVEIDTAALSLQGASGARLRHNLKVSTPDKKPVFAHGWSDQPWITVGPPQFQGSQVGLPLEMAVPRRPGALLEARVTVRANGNQRFVVPVTVKVEDGPLELVPLEEENEPLAELYPVGIPHAPAARTTARKDETLVELYPVATVSRPPRSRARPAPPPASSVATFGMWRRVYWTGLVGGWSAFAGWLVAELMIGRWVGDSVLLAILMVMLVGSALGAGISQVEALFTSQWQNFLPRLGLGALGGFVGGLIGGLFGNLLFALLGQGFAVLAFIGRVLGWTLLGLSIGACEGLLRQQWRQARNGLIGGSIGGFLGGLLFDPVSALIGSPVSSRAFAFVLLGLFIGLALGLVQVLLKEAWLTVEEGFRPGRQLILKEEVTTMGTSEKAGLIFIAYGAQGVEPVHLRVRRLPGGAFLLDDNKSRGGTLLNGERIEKPIRLEDGDVIQLGINKVRFNETLRPRRDSAE
jgi:hypothetical protein